MAWPPTGLLPMITIDHLARPNSDAFLELYVSNDRRGSVTQRFCVLRSVLEGISKPWENIVKDSLAFNHQNRRLILPTVDNLAMEILLLIVHHHYTKVPRVLTLEKIVAVAELMERFECHGYMVPWAQDWLEPHRRKILPEPDGDQRRVFLFPGYEVWLYVASQFGLEEDYVVISDYLLYRGRQNGIGQLLSPSSNSPLKNRHISGPIARIKTEQRRLLERLFVKVFDILEDFDDNSICRIVTLPMEFQAMCMVRLAARLKAFLNNRGIVTERAPANPNLLRSVADTVSMMMYTPPDAHFDAFPFERFPEGDPTRHIICNQFLERIDWMPERDPPDMTYVTIGTDYFS
ncbi:hypothetical protein T440DRAFT_519701 [Plenodomus tracheiphilus IPT5]|uniref:Uncharacterized protein n=1 Tax=Plenodomus tracheiphilus IPT5 TaxID=1408161 RepID=A0A6A7B2C2_9PLEO|nr:hypothetical protein T440DRAFT_519701 [Plenodomus tracheiphilus IPT5]